MSSHGTSWVRTILIWASLATVVAVPLAAAATSPQLAWRDPVYIVAGFAGNIAMSLMLVQPLLAGRYLPGLSTQRSRRLHRVIGSFLVMAVAIHVAALWVTSPPDVVDALLFRSPTQFSVWGVIAMWAVFAAALMVALRRQLGLKLNTWRLGHTALVVVIVVTSVVHSILIEGTMETMSKVALCALILSGTVKVVVDLRVLTRRTRSHRNVPKHDKSPKANTPAP